MPRGDRTGPTGMGPMTGRGAGVCAGSNTPGFMNRGFGFFGRGRGGGGGGGRGRRNMFYATGLTGWQRAAMGGQDPASMPQADNEKQMLEAQVGMMQSQLDALKQRLTELEAEKE